MIDVEHWPPYAQSDMYVLSSDVVAWLGSDAAQMLQQVGPIGVAAEGLREIVGEGPILASWLLMIQVHAQLGGTGCGIGGQDAPWLSSGLPVSPRDGGATEASCSASSIMNSFATVGLHRAEDILNYWELQETQKRKCTSAPQRRV